jgi:hypothetical protein
MNDQKKPHSAEFEARSVEHFEADLTKGGRCKPWHQQEDESISSYGRFSMYLKLGPFKRSFKMVEEKGHSLSAVAKLSSKWNWVSRAEAWDLHLIEVEQKQAEREAKTLASRLMRDRNRVQEQFRKAVIHETEGAVRQLHKVAMKGTDSSKIKAWEVILKGAGYEAPIGLNIDAIDDDIIKTILERELAALVEALPEAKAALFSELLVEAFNGLSNE